MRILNGNLYVSFEKNKLKWFKNLTIFVQRYDPYG